MEPSLLKRLTKIITGTSKRFRRHHGKVRASALTYNSLLALIPFVILLSAVAGQYRFLELGLQWLQYASDQFDWSLPIAKYTPIVKHLQALEFRNLGWIGAGSLLLTLWMTLTQVEDALNHMWWVFKKRPLLQRVMIYTPFLTLLLVLLLVCVRLLSLLGEWAFARLQQETDVFMELLEWGAVLAFFGIWIWLLIFMLLWILPNARVKIGNALKASVIVSIVWGLTVFVILSLTAFLFERYSVLYGSIAILPVVLIGLYISWTIILMGSALAAELQGVKAPSQVTKRNDEKK